MHSLLDELLCQQGWQTVVFDSLCAGWALQKILRHYSRGARPRFVYVSHNHEESVRRQLIANNLNFIRRQALHFDGIKLINLERSLVRSADLVTTITADDRVRYQCFSPEKPIEVLTPGYGGRALFSRRLGAHLPRRAIIIGSFDWIAKRMNLEEFVRVADPLFAAKGAELDVVGNAEHSLLDRMRKGVTATRFVGPVERLEEYMDQSRIAIVPERSGGGFKLKILDYVFNRLPIFALQGSVAGVPLQSGDSIELRPTQMGLANAILKAIDDFDGLNRLQQAAFTACEDKFNWASRGEQLSGAIAAL
jgi:polysaccharide biosynthesis protein PslH